LNWLPLALSLACGLVIAPVALHTLEQAGLVRENYRGIRLPTGLGAAAAASALVALGPLAPLEELADADVFRAGSGPVLVYGLGITLLGLLDDLLGGTLAGRAGPDAPRGWRGHGEAAASGRLTTGALKALGALGLALYVMAGQGRSAGEYLLAVGVLVLATNVFNLLDLRPGRALKALALLGAGLTLGAWDVVPLQTLGLLLGALLALAPDDLLERGMLGDAGSNLAGALAGFWLVLTLDTTGEAIALFALFTVTVYGEFRSISALVEKNPLLRRLDCLGRRA
jgi:hypothetical protein